MWLLAQRSAQLESAEQVQRFVSLAVCLRLDSALLNLLQLVGRDAVLDRAVLLVWVVILHFPLLDQRLFSACRRNCAA